MYTNLVLNYFTNSSKIHLALRAYAMMSAAGVANTPREVLFAYQNSSELFSSMNIRCYELMSNTSCRLPVVA